MVELLKGVGWAALMVIVCELLLRRRRAQPYAVGLVMAALIYVGFSIADFNLAWVGIELVGLLIFSVIVFFAFKYSPYVLALGWAAHAVWDVTLHNAKATPFVPRWYPMVCIGFDLAIAVYLLVRVSRWPAALPQSAQSD